MKAKQILFFAAAAAMFAACSSSDDGFSSSQVAQPQGTGEIAVNFNSYVNRTTRAGLTGVLENTASSLQTSGFGVFGYYTNADNYDQSFIPDFMYNQHVTASGSTWTYTPIKYWPNEFGSGAFSDDVDKVSFFAYAPFVSVNASSGKVKDNHASTYGKDNGDVTMGIVGMKRNNDTGDPMIKYISTFYTDEQVDLAWGTISTDFGTSGWALKNDDGAVPAPLTAGLPWLNMQHPKATSSSWNAAQKITFDFKHALASLNVTVDTYTNKVTPVGGSNAGDPDSNTKVFVRSVTFEGFDTKGALNLNNASPNVAFWYNFDCLNELNNGAEITIKDGRKDGKEGITAATKEYAAINPTLVQSKTWNDASLTAGVTSTETNLFAKYNGGGVIQPEGDEEAPIFVIPNGDPLKVTIEYDVLTADTKLADKLNDGVTTGSVVKNVITRYITADEAGSVSGGAFQLVNGKKYKIKLHLGLNSVEFDASVTGWDSGDNGGADLPHNN